jgi:hypothetical protein
MHIVIQITISFMIAGDDEDEAVLAQLLAAKFYISFATRATARIVLLWTHVSYQPNVAGKDEHVAPRKTG